MEKIRWNDQERISLHEEIFKSLQLKWPFDKNALRVVRSMFINPEIQMRAGIDPLRVRTSSSAYEIELLKKYITERAVDEAADFRPVAPEVHEQITKAVEEGRIIDDRPVAATPSLPDVPELLLAVATPFSERMSAALNGLFPAAPTIEQHNGVLHLVRQILQQNIDQQYLINELGEKLVSIESKLVFVEGLLEEFTAPGITVPTERISNAIKNAPTAKLARIAIVGLHDPERDSLSKYLTGHVNFALYHGREHRRDFQGFDHLFYMVDRCKHSESMPIIKKNKENIVKVNGGIKELKRQIDIRYPK